MGRKQYFKLKNIFSSGAWAATEIFVEGANPKKGTSPDKDKKGPHKRKGCKKAKIFRNKMIKEEL